MFVFFNNLIFVDALTNLLVAELVVVVFVYINSKKFGKVTHACKLAVGLKKNVSDSMIEFWMFVSERRNVAIWIKSIDSVYEFIYIVCFFARVAIAKIGHQKKIVAWGAV